MVVYSDRFVPNGSAGCVRVLLVPVIFIRPEYKDDAGLHAHEEVHVAQAWRCIIPPIHAVRYAFDKAYRLACEVEAYRVQLTYAPHAALKFAEFIANDYGLDVSVGGALKLLTG